MAPVELSEAVNLTPKRELLELASLSVLNSIKEGIPGIVDWAKAHILNEPLTIYDINGKPLFLDFKIRRGGQTLGTIRTGASRILGVPVIAFELGSRSWNYNDAVRKLTPTVENDHPGWNIIQTRLVCYSYPKLGVMFEMTDRGGEHQSLIFDVADLSPIPEKPVSDVEGAYAWSFYDSLPHNIRRIGLDLYERFDQWRLSIPRIIREGFRGNAGLTRFSDMIEGAPGGTVTKQLQFCTHYDYNEARSHHCFVLHAQQKNDYCAVATCQMILCFYRYYYSQDHIARRLRYSPGGCPSDTSSEYENLTFNHVDATYDSSPTWEKARSQIDALHPLKSGIIGHARACTGYSFFQSVSGLEIQDKKLYIYDPWPWNTTYKSGGSVYWENWDSVMHTNFIYTRIRCLQ